MLWIWWLLGCGVAPTLAAVKGTSNSGKTSSSSGGSGDSAKPSAKDLPFRHKNLDYWDVDTLAAYFSISPVSPHVDVVDDDDENKGPLYAGHDAAIMFYAQWDTNSHSLAPLWSQIAEVKEAGTVDADVVMALFDCESKTVHKTICTAAGVTHYPTMMYVGRGRYHDSDPVTSALGGQALKKKFVPFGPTRLPQTVKFQGDWRYGNQIMDWMDMMKKISDWNKWVDGTGFSNKSSLFPKILRWILRPFLPNSSRKNKKKSNKSIENGKEMIPVGVPKQVLVKQLMASSATPKPNSSIKNETFPMSLQEAMTKAERLEKENKKLKDDAVKLKDATSHSSLLIESFLFSSFVKDDPITGTSTAVDVFEYLKDSWDDYPRIGEIIVDPDADIKPVLVQSCVVDMALDYCSRFLLRNALDRYDAIAEQKKQKEQGKDVNSTSAVEEIDARKEPYCDIVESCAKNNFATKECRPQECPFVSAITNNQSTNTVSYNMACRYMNACLDPDILKEYQNAVDNALESAGSKKKETPVGDSATGKTTSTTTAGSGTGTSEKKTGAWGLKK